MRIRGLVPCSLLLATLAVPAIAGRATVRAAPGLDIPSSPESMLKTRAARPFRRPVNADVDARVLASLLASSIRGDFDVVMRATEVACIGGTCSVSLTVRLPEETAPSRLAFAVAGPKGDLSDVRHAECLTSLCSVTLIVERGRNTIAVGVSNEMTQTAGFATTGVNAAPNVAMSGRSKSEWF